MKLVGTKPSIVAGAVVIVCVSAGSFPDRHRTMMSSTLEEPLHDLALSNLSAPQSHLILETRNKDVDVELQARGPVIGGGEIFAKAAAIFRLSPDASVADVLCARDLNRELLRSGDGLTPQERYYIRNYETATRKVRVSNAIKRQMSPAEWDAYQRKQTHFRNSHETEAQHESIMQALHEAQQRKRAKRKAVVLRVAERKDGHQVQDAEEKRLASVQAMRHASDQAKSVGKGEIPVATDALLTRWKARFNKSAASQAAAVPDVPTELPGPSTAGSSAHARSLTPSAGSNAAATSLQRELDGVALPRQVQTKKLRLFGFDIVVSAA